MLFYVLHNILEKYILLSTVVLGVYNYQLHNRLQMYNENISSYKIWSIVKKWKYPYCF